MHPIFIVCLFVFGFAILCAAFLVAFLHLQLLKAMELITVLLYSKALVGPQGIPGAMGPAGRDAVLPPHLMLQPPPLDSKGVARVMRQAADGAWKPGEHVRENSTAWHKAWNTPGTALQGEDGELHLGIQL